jgi:putative DeoR family transcriptional regulator (stage III sporulation protein D)
MGRPYPQGGVGLKGLPEERAVALAEYIVEHEATVRQTAQVFHISKSTVHKDVAERLRGISPGLYLQAQAVLQQNKAQRHIRGGLATRQKYADKALRK